MPALGAAGCDDGLVEGDPVAASVDETGGADLAMTAGALGASDKGGPATPTDLTAKDTHCERLRVYYENQCINNQWRLVQVGTSDFSCNLEEGPQHEGSVTGCWEELRAGCNSETEGCDDIPHEPSCAWQGPCGTVITALPPIDVPPGTIGPVRPADAGTEPAPGTVKP